MGVIQRLKYQHKGRFGMLPIGIGFKWFQGPIRRQGGDDKAI